MISSKSLFMKVQGTSPMGNRVELIGSATIQLFHNSGILVRSIEFDHPDMIEMNLEGLESGMYFIAVVSETETETKSLIIVN